MAGEGDAERLVVLLEARIRDFEKNMQKASGTASSSFSRMRQDSRSATRQMEADIVRSSTRINQALASTSARIGDYGKAMAGSLVGAFAGAAVLRGATELIDANTRVTNSLKVAGLQGEALKSVYGALFASAQKNAAPLESLATLYGRVSLVQKELGVSTADLLKFTDNVSLALRVAGTDAGTASGALLQLSQAMGSGTVRAEEFNSILEGAQPIAQAVAAGMTEAGGSVARLRQLVVDGKVSSQAFFAAFQAGAAMLQAKVAGATLTTGQAMIRLQNVLQDAAGKFDTVSGASASFSTAIEGVANAVDRVTSSRILEWLGKINSLVQRGVFQDLSGTLQQVETVLKLVDAAAAASADSFEGVADSAEDAVAATLGFEHAGDAPAALKTEIEALAASVVAGTTDAATLRAELVRLGASPLNLGIQIGQIMDLARAAQAAAASVAAARGAAAAQSELPVWDRRENEDRTNRARPSDFTAPFPDQRNLPPLPVKPPNLLDYDPNAGAGRGGGRSGGGGAAAATSERDAVEELIGSLEDELALVGKSDAERAIANNLRYAGAGATEAEKAKITELTRSLSDQEETYHRTREAAEAFAGVAKDAIGGVIADLRNGKTLAEAFGDALDRVADKLIDMALDAAFAPAGKKGGGIVGTLLQSVIGAITGGLGAPAAGGVYAEGGYTGPGGKYQPAGVVHAGEYVFDAASTRRIGVANLEAMRRGRKGYADGGLVTPAAMSASGSRSAPRTSPANSVINMKLTIDLAGANGDEAIAKVAREAAAAGATQAYNAAVGTARRGASGWVAEDRQSGEWRR